MNKIIRVNLAILVLGLLSVAGCMRIGPDSIDRDQFAYTDTISES